MRALEAEQHAAKAANDNGSLRTAKDPRSAHSPYRPRTRRGPQHRRLHPHRRLTIACSLLAAALVVLAVQLASGTGPNRGGHPSRAVGSGPTAPSRRTNRGSDEQLPRHGTRRRSRAQPNTSPDHSHIPAEAAPSPACKCRQLKIAGTIALPKQEHSIDRPAHRTRPARPSKSADELDPALELDAHRVKSTPPQRTSRTPHPTRTRAQAPPPNPKRPSVRWSLEPAAAAANSPHASNVDRKVGDT